MACMARVLTSSPSTSSLTDPMADPDFRRFYSFYKTFRQHDDTPSKPSPTLNANAECSVTTKRTQAKTPPVANKRRQTRSQAVTQIPASLLGNKSSDTVEE